MATTAQSSGESTPITTSGRSTTIELIFFIAFDNVVEPTCRIISEISLCAKIAENKSFIRALVHFFLPSHRNLRSASEQRPKQQGPRGLLTRRLDYLRGVAFEISRYPEGSRRRLWSANRPYSCTSTFDRSNLLSPINTDTNICT